MDALSGRAVELRCRETVEAVREREAAGPWLAPGWIDLQINGYAGVDYNAPDAPAEEIGRSLRSLFATGVTRLFPTVITGDPEDMLGAVRNLAGARERLAEGEAIEGIHLEGPHISPEDGPRGAHPRRWVRRPSAHEFHRMQDAARGLIRIVTLSPEWPEAPRYIETLVSEGVVVSLGHMNATSGQIADAVSAGATMSTHLGNGVHKDLPHRANYLWDQLAEDRLAAGFIADGVHLAPAFLKLAVRAKGVERSILVTDAVAPAASLPGRYKLGEQDVDVREDGRVTLAGQDRLAGSTLRMDRGVENLMRLAGLSLADAVRMATVNPARAARIEGREKGLDAGERADVVEFTCEGGAITVLRTRLSGRVVYEASYSNSEAR
jgi:N-acetylglucosamine-6-phosphate deacetylase